MGWFGLENRRLKYGGELISVFHNLQGGCREERDRFFSEVHSERSRCSNHKLYQGIAHWAKGTNSSCEVGPALARAVHGAWAMSNILNFRTLWEIQSG